MKLLIPCILMLGGCATTVEGVEQEPVVETYASSKQPLEIAKCMQGEMPGLHIEFPGERVSVSSRNPYGAILLNWLISETPTGSAIELRKANSITPGRAMAEGCF